MVCQKFSRPFYNYVRNLVSRFTRWFALGTDMASKVTTVSNDTDHVLDTHTSDATGEQVLLGYCRGTV